MNGRRTDGRNATTLDRPVAGKAGLTRVCIVATGQTHVGDRDGQPACMVEAGGRPLLWHNLMHFNAHGIRDFVVAVGTGGDRVKRYLLDYANLGSDLTLRLDRATVSRTGGSHPDWSIDLIDVTAPGGVQRVQESCGGAPCIVSSGDCLCDFEPAALLAFHRQQGRLATLLAVRPQARFGTLDIEDGRVRRFAEKPQQEDGWVSSGILALEADALDLVASRGDTAALADLASREEVAVYRHGGFWQRVETLRDKQVLDEQWLAGKAAWRIREWEIGDNGRAATE